MHTVLLSHWNSVGGTNLGSLTWGMTYKGEEIPMQSPTTRVRHTSASSSSSPCHLFLQRPARRYHTPPLFTGQAPRPLASSLTSNTTAGSQLGNHFVFFRLVHFFFLLPAPYLFAFWISGSFGQGQGRGWAGRGPGVDEAGNYRTYLPRYLVMHNSTGNKDGLACCAKHSLHARVAVPAKRARMTFWSGFCLARHGRMSSVKVSRERGL